MSQSYPVSERTLLWLETVLAARFGNAWHLSKNLAGLSLSLKGGDGAIVFDTLQACFTEAGSDLSFSQWDAEGEGWHPVLEGLLPTPGVEYLPTPLIEKRGRDHVIHYDILGLTYWILTRIEEIGRTDLDMHGRFPAAASHAYKHGYLDRPVVDEWLEILGQVILRQWPAIQLKCHSFKVRVSHDVDQPFQYLFVTRSGIARQTLGDLAKRRNAGLAIERYRAWKAVRAGNLQRDPFNTFDWIMDQAEAKGVRSVFYFICGRTNQAMDASYEIETTKMRGLLRSIHVRGHEIGLHPSYETYLKPELIAEEYARLRRVCTEEGIEQDSWGGRMHYLRWAQPQTLQAWEDAGLNYDSTLGYADRPGFRCGTCHEYTTFNPITQRALNLVERPLVVMECSIFDDQYMGIANLDAAESMMLKYQNACRAVNGQFNLLWHNNNFQTSGHRHLYRSLI